MQQELNQVANLALFARIVQTGGISRCAADLGIERTTVSRRLSDLERDLGVQLLIRSPKNLNVTEAGKLCFERCEELLRIARDAQTAATSGNAVVGAEPIVVGAPPDIIDCYLGSKLAQFEAENPKITVQSYPMSCWTKDAFMSVDLMIGWDAPSSADALVRKLVGVEQSVYASPEYLSKRGTVESPQEIRNHTCIVDDARKKNRTWKFDRDLDSCGVLLKSWVEVSGMLEARAATLAGLGLCRLPKYLCERHVTEGRLIPLLAEHTPAARSLLLISPTQGITKPRATTLRLFIESVFSEHAL
ncbi:MAG: LysR family transcriptional regulator [Woeseiaceae bacterium]|nr:LysR family transcriptional regulator [Woeseiaceae bacterium]